MLQPCSCRLSNQSSDDMLSVTSWRFHLCKTRGAEQQLCKHQLLHLNCRMPKLKVPWVMYIYVLWTLLRDRILGTHASRCNTSPSPNPGSPNKKLSESSRTRPSNLERVVVTSFLELPSSLLSRRENISRKSRSFLLLTPLSFIPKPYYEDFCSDCGLHGVFPCIEPECSNLMFNATDWACLKLWPFESRLATWKTSI